jgi:hypothetical protein
MPEIWDIHDLPIWMDERLSNSGGDELAVALGIVQVLADPEHLSGVLKSTSPCWPPLRTARTRTITALTR